MSFMFGWVRALFLVAQVSHGTKDSVREIVNLELDCGVASTIEGPLNIESAPSVSDSWKSFLKLSEPPQETLNPEASTWPAATISASFRDDSGIGSESTSEAGKSIVTSTEGINPQTYQVVAFPKADNFEALSERRKREYSESAGEKRAVHGRRDQKRTALEAAETFDPETHVKVIKSALSSNGILLLGHQSRCGDSLHYPACFLQHSQGNREKSFRSNLFDEDDIPSSHIASGLSIRPGNMLSPEQQHMRTEGNHCSPDQLERRVMRPEGAGNHQLERNLCLLDTRNFRMRGQQIGLQSITQNIDPFDQSIEASLARDQSIEASLARDQSESIEFWEWVKAKGLSHHIPPEPDRQLQTLFANHERDRQEFWVWATGKGIFPAQALKTNPGSPAFLMPRADSHLPHTGFLSFRHSQRTVSQNNFTPGSLAKAGTSARGNFRDSFALS